MNLKHLAAAALLSLSTAALADGHFERTLSVSSSPDLSVITSSGNIQIHPGAGNQIHISAHIHSSWSVFGAGSSEEAIRRIEDHPPITQSGNSVQVGPLPDKTSGISIDYDITAPAATALNLRSASGDITTEGLGRFVTASTASGDLRVHGLNGPADLQSASGDITLDESGAGEIKARSASGTITIHGLRGPLTAHSASGDITAEGQLQGPATLSTSSGSVHLHLGSSARFNLEASTSSGDIRIHYPNAPQQDDHNRHHLTAPINGGGSPLEVHTSSGDIEISS